MNNAVDNKNNPVPASEGSGNATQEGKLYRKPHTTSTAACTLEQVLDPENIDRARWNVYSNAGRMKNRKLAEQIQTECKQWNADKWCCQIRHSEYLPKPYTECIIPKDNGGVRKLNIQGTTDRIISQSIRQVIEPVCESSIFEDSSYAYRPNRSIADILREIEANRSSGVEYIVRMDLNKFFDSIDHAVLMQELRKLHADPELVKLLKTIIRKSSVREYGSRMITPVRVGIPQGGILSPLLANLYGSIMDREMRSYKEKYMRYADDLIILCASMDDCDKVIRCVQRAADKMKVKINMDKTFIGRITETTVFSIGFSENGMYVPERHFKRWWHNKALDNDNIQEAFEGLLAHYINISPTVVLHKQSVETIESVIRRQNYADSGNLFCGLEKAMERATDKLIRSQIITDVHTSGSGQVA